MSGADGALRVASCSGFYGDRLAAMREVLEGGEVDVVTGDYLAELTMLILGRDRQRDASLGYARTFLRQAEDCLGLALEQGVRVVANAGGLNPAGLAARLREVAAAQGLAPRVAWVDGDDLLPRADELGWTDALTANAYLGAAGITRALAAGADVVVTGRVTDASLVVGPAAWHHRWGPDDLDALAGAMVAGHVLECGTQATGGNFSGFLDLPRDARPLGFPLAEVAADGSAVVTKHAGTGGAVTVDTVTAQLLYEVQSEHYLGPDVTVDLASVALTQEGPDRVRVSGVRGLRPPAQLKVCVNALGGWRNQVELVLTGLDLAEKEAWVRAQLGPALRASSVTWSRSGTPAEDAPDEEAASLRLRVTVRDPDADVVGKAFTAPVVELALASYPGFALTAPPGPATPYGVYRAAYVDRALVEHTVHLPDGSVEVVPDHLPGDRGGGAATGGSVPEEVAQRPSRRAVPMETGPFETGPFETGLRPSAGTGGSVPEEVAQRPSRRAVPLETGPFETGPFETGLRPSSGTGGSVTARVPLGTFVHARSGDKGGDANVGLWVRAGERQEERTAWLLAFVTPATMRTLLPEAADLDVEVHPLPNLHGVNVLLRGLLGEGVAASTRFDPQAKAVGEWLRSRHVDIPVELL